MTYRLCLKLLANGKLTQDMLDAFFAAGRITAEQYAALIAALDADKG